MPTVGQLLSLTDPAAVVQRATVASSSDNSASVCVTSLGSVINGTGSVRNGGSVLIVRAGRQRWAIAWTSATW